jgi:hypothetical protein
MEYPPRMTCFTTCVPSSGPVLVNIIYSDLNKRMQQNISIIFLAEDRDQWRALVTTIMNLRVP